MNIEKNYESVRDEGNHNEENEMNGNALHPISEESDDIEVNQFFGSVLAREVWQNKKINKEVLTLSNDKLTTEKGDYKDFM